MNEKKSVQNSGPDNMYRLIFTLVMIGIISGFVLSFVFQWTAPHIEQHRLAAQREAVFSVLPGTVEYEEEIGERVVFFRGFDEHDNQTGVAVLISGSGFQGDIEIMVGTDPRAEKIRGIKILDHTETPGLGARITEQQFLNHFEDMPFGTYQLVQQDPGEMEVEGISGATISARNVVQIVERAVGKIQDYTGGGR